MLYARVTNATVKKTSISLTNQVSTWTTALLQKLTALQLVKKVAAYDYGTCRYLTHVHNNPPLVPILMSINPVYAFPFCFRSILILYSDLCRDLPNVLSSSFGFPHKSPVFTSRLSHSVICPAPFILLDRFARMHRLRFSTLCNLLQFSVYSHLLDPNIFLSTLFSNTLSLWFLYI
jgi:hypothetical protein